MSSVHSLTNVSFPRGFTPSQCALLASRQRNSNYLYFKASNDWEDAKPIFKEPANISRTHNLKPTLKHEIGARESKSPNDLSGVTDHEMKSVNFKTGLTGYFKWKSKEEIAKYLAAHAHARLLWIQESAKMNEEMSGRGKDMNERMRLSPRNTVYLYNKDLKKRF